MFKLLGGAILYFYECVNVIDLPSLCYGLLFVRRCLELSELLRRTVPSIDGASELHELLRWAVPIGDWRNELLELPKWAIPAVYWTNKLLEVPQRAVPSIDGTRELRFMRRGLLLRARGHGMQCVLKFGHVRGCGGQRLFTLCCRASFSRRDFDRWRSRRLVGWRRGRSRDVRLSDRISGHCTSE